MREDDEERRLLEAVRRATAEAAELRERADAASAVGRPPPGTQPCLQNAPRPPGTYLNPR